MKRVILVTGGAGFIGSNFVRYLYHTYPEYKILVLDALTYAGSIHNLPKNGFASDRLEFWYGNVRNSELVGKLVSRSDWVVHFAAESHVTRSIYDNQSFFETDVLGTQVVANSVLKHRDNVELFLHISTSEVYGNALSPKMDETHPLNPMSPYAAAKCGADRLVYSYWQTYKIPVVTIRPFNNFGPYQHLEKLIPRFITSCILGEPLYVHGDGTASRDWLFVQDHCAALDLLLHTQREKIIGQTFNLGSGYSISILEIAKIIREIMRSSHIPIQFVGNRPGQVFRHTCNWERVKEGLGWEPQTPFLDGIQRTIRWYRENENWWRSQVWMRSIPIVTAEGKRELH